VERSEYAPDAEVTLPGLNNVYLEQWVHSVNISSENTSQHKS